MTGQHNASCVLSIGVHNYYGNKIHCNFFSYISIPLGDTHTRGVHPTPPGLTCCHGEKVVKVSAFSDNAVMIILACIGSTSSVRLC